MRFSSLLRNISSSNNPKKRLVIFGLGCFPYPTVRRSIGVNAVNKLSKHLQTSRWEVSKRGLNLFSKKDDLLLIKPRAYLPEKMRLSVKSAIEEFALDAKEVVFIFGTTDLDLGEMSISKGPTSKDVAEIQNLGLFEENNVSKRVAIGLMPHEEEEFGGAHEDMFGQSIPVHTELFWRNKFPPHQQKILDTEIFGDLDTFFEKITDDKYIQVQEEKPRTFFDTLDEWIHDEEDEEGEGEGEGYEEYEEEEEGDFRLD